MGVNQRDGGVPPRGSVKERAMPWLCTEWFLLNRKGEGDQMRFSDLALTPVLEDGEVGEAAGARVGQRCQTGWRPYWG